MCRCIINPNKRLCLEWQGGRRGGEAPAGQEGRTIPAEPGPPGPRGGAGAPRAPQGAWAGGWRFGPSPGHSAVFSPVGSLGLADGASQGVPRLRVCAPHVWRSSTERPVLPDRGGTAAVVAHAGSWARGSAWPGLPSSTGSGGRSRGRPATGGSASASPPCIQVPFLPLSLLLLLGSRATGSSWRLCPTALPLQGRGRRASGEPEGCGLGTGERASLLPAPCGCGPGWSPGWEGARGVCLQLDEEEGSFHLLLLSHFLRGARRVLPGRVSDLGAHGCDHRQLTRPRGSTTARVLIVLSLRRKVRWITLYCALRSFLCLSPWSGWSASGS